MIVYFIILEWRMVRKYWRVPSDRQYTYTWKLGFGKKYGLEGKFSTMIKIMDLVPGTTAGTNNPQCKLFALSVLRILIFTMEIIKNSILVLLGQINDLMDIKYFNSIWHLVNLVHTLTVISLNNIDCWLIRIQRVICSLKALERIRQNEKGIILSRKTLRNLWNNWHFQDRERRNTQWGIKHGKWNTKNTFKEGLNIYSAIKTFSSSRKASTEMHLWD